MFWKVEARTGLYIFFKTVCDYYGLIPEDNYTIPSEAEGIEVATESRATLPPMIMKREPSGPGPEDDNSTIIEGITDNNLSTAGTTKRHRHSPSVGATAVSTVVEEAEEEEERPQLHSRPITQIFESTPEDDDEAQPKELSDEAEAAEESVLDVPDAAEPEDEPKKQSSSEEAKEDPVPQNEEKQNNETGVVTDADEASVNTDAEVSGAKASDVEDIEESADAKDEANEDSATTAETETKKSETKTTPASATAGEHTEEKMPEK